MGIGCQIELLGCLRVRVGKRLISRFRTQKTASLLAYLAFYLGRPQPRETLIELFWPEATPEAGRQSLSQALSSLRAQMEPPGMPAGMLILADRSTVQLNAQATTTDVAEFEDALRAAERSSTQRERAQHLADAVELYCGPFLPGYYDDWSLTEQARLEARFSETLQQLIAHCEQAGDPEAALRFGRRAVSADPLNEDAHRRLMLLHMASGEPAQAMRQYRELERALEQGLGERPSAETRRLVGQIEREEAVARSRNEVPMPPRVPKAARASANISVGRPSGVVTFLLTDVERSTSQWESIGDAFGNALQEHRTLLRELVMIHGGQEINDGGDGFLVAFTRPTDALACAVAGQKALSARQGAGAPGVIRVRMALHTGEVELEAGEYHGLTLHRATRMLTAAHGGQILSSEATSALLRRGLEPGLRLSDLGTYRLRDVEAPERIYQVDYPGMAEHEFPALRAEMGYQNNLPLASTRFFGRKEEIVRLHQLLLDPQVRLVTLTGPGGTGKTRLALQASEQLVDAFSGAVWFVPLADLSDGRLIGTALVNALGIAPSDSGAPFEQAAALLAAQPSLLILDNFEQVLDAGVSLVQILLERAPALTCLVTSRRSLGLPSEREFAVSPLPVPHGTDTPQRLSLYESVQLFVDRAQAVRPDFQVTTRNAAALAELCDRLEGIPLALELAAARAQVLTPAQMLSQLAHRFDLLVSRRLGAAERHRTLRAAIDWSHRLLSPHLQRFFAQLSVFHGGWSLAAAEAVCGEPLALDFLTQLRECSLILAEEEHTGSGSQMRFRMLETLREYAAEQVGHEDMRVLRQRHLDFYTDLAEGINARLTGREEAAWLELLECEQENFRAALDWGIDHADRGETLLRLGASLVSYWDRHVADHCVRDVTGRRYLAAILSREDAREATKARADALHVAGLLRWTQQAARPFHEEALAIYRGQDDRAGIAASLSRLGEIALDFGTYDVARTYFEQSLGLWRSLAGRRGIADCLLGLGTVARELGAALEARERCTEALDLVRSLGDRRAIATTLAHLGALASELGDNEAARQAYEESLTIWREREDRGAIAAALAHLGHIAGVQARYPAAISHFEEALAINQEIDLAGAARNLASLNSLAREHGNQDEAASYFERVRRISQENLAGYRASGDGHELRVVLEGAAALAAMQEPSERAVHLYGALDRLRETADGRGRSWSWTPEDHSAQERALSELRSRLGEQKFEAAVAVGRTVTLEQAIAAAVTAGS